MRSMRWMPAAVTILLAGCHALLPLGSPSGTDPPDLGLEGLISGTDLVATDHAEPDHRWPGDVPTRDGTVAPPDAPATDLHLSSDASPCQGTLFAASFNTLDGWAYPEQYPQPKAGDPSVAEYANASMGGAAYNADAKGLFTLPPGCHVRLTLTKSFASGSMTVSYYTKFCKSGSTCAGIGSIGCLINVGTSSCQLSTYGGATVYTLRLSRPDSGGSTATASFLAVTLEP